MGVGATLIELIQGVGERALMMKYLEKLEIGQAYFCVLYLR